MTARARHSPTRSLLFTACLMLVPVTSAAFTVGYVETNNHPVEVVGCFQYADDGTNFFDVGVIFAASIVGESPNRPEVFYNPNVTKILEDGGQIRRLKAKGIQVLLTYMPYHKNAGWSCMTDYGAAERFAGKLVREAHKYGLDGVDIDDEYYKCPTNDTSLIMIGKAFRSHPERDGLVLTKALFRDGSYFNASYEGTRLADVLDYGWEMSYWGADGAARLQSYRDAGFDPDRLAIGMSTEARYQSVGPQLFGYAQRSDIGGAMVFNVKPDSAPYLSRISGRKVINVCR